MEKFSAKILKDTISIKPGRFVFNSITVNNNSFQDLTLGLRFLLPDGWSFITIPNASLEVKRGEFINLPFRILPSKSALGDLLYPITIFFKNPISGVEVHESFFVKIDQNTKWNANLLNSNIVINENDSLSKFQLNIRNNGNKRELFEINLKSELRLGLPSSGLQVMLRPGADTLLNIYVASRYKTSSAKSVSFFIKSKNETVMLSGNVYFASEVYQGNKSKFGSFPIDIEYFNINALTRGSSYSFFDINGNYNLKNNKIIGLRIRTNSFNPDFSLNTQYYNLSYRSQKVDLSIGTQNLFFNYQINGYGARMAYTTNSKKMFEMYGVQSIISNAQIIGLKTENNKIENRVISTNALFLSDKTSNTTSMFALHNFEKKYSTSKSFSLSAGYSSEKKELEQNYTLGYMGGYRFETRLKFAKIQSTFQYYSDKFPGILKGVKYGSHDIQMGNKTKSIAFFSESNTRQPFFEENQVIGQLQNYQSQEHGLRIELAKQNSRGIAGFSYLDQYQQNNSFGKMSGLKSSFNLSTYKSHFMQSFMFNFMKTSVKEIDNNKIHDSYGIFYQLKYKSLGLNANYTNGPNFYFDYISFVSANLNPKTHNVSLFYEFKNKSRTFYDRINISNSNNSIFSKTNMVLRNELYFELPKAKASVSVFSNINVLDISQLPSLNVSVKKTFNLPLVIKQKYYSASIFLFKDNNNNNIFDKGEEPIADVNLQINGQALKTNKKGMVFMKNVEKEEYIIDYRKIQNLKGWVPKDKNLDTLFLDRDISIGVPFKQSKMVAGKVKFEIENSNKEAKESLNGILIIATNKKGEIFRSTTNEKGEFYLNLKEDFYNVQIPTNIFGEDNRVEKSIISIDLLKENYSEIEFKIIQKKRKMNIKKE
ncbi:hypothetical protein [Lacihabitans sp. LS3-19]|uniref:COG1470 family protein n=1 Tax=Lacihabitans sp. LS3-19 TaxID=2487335 RepID=UPI0020CE64CF|nr:hypothetical protein [Lacihabitans sp. LS3-19]